MTLSFRIPNSIFYQYTYYRHIYFFFFFNDPAPPEIYPLPLHDALPISRRPAQDAPEPVRADPTGERRAARRDRRHRLPQAGPRRDLRHPARPARRALRALGRTALALRPSGLRTRGQDHDRPRVPPRLAADAAPSAPPDLVPRAPRARAHGPLARRPRAVRGLGQGPRPGSRARRPAREGLRRRAAPHDGPLRPAARRLDARGRMGSRESRRIRGVAGARGGLPRAGAPGTRRRGARGGAGRPCARPSRCGRPERRARVARRGLTVRPPVSGARRRDPARPRSPVLASRSDYHDR